jgi:hypothetical protein
MRNARLAEWILSLVTTPERAAATVGDLLEDRVDVGALRFWSAVMLTSLSLLWRDVAEHPLRMVRLAALGLVLQLLLSFGMTVGYVVLFAVYKLAWSAFVSFEPGPSWSRFTGMGGIILLWLTGWGALLLSQFQVGRVLAKRSPGRELAPCVATTLLGLAIAFPIALGLGGRAEFSTGQRITEVMHGSSPAISPLSQIPLLLALLAGAARVRRQRHSISS